MRTFGLIGYPLGHSFSQRFFTEKFAREGITDARYEAFPLPNLSGLPALLTEHPDLCGLNVTIPHKQSILPWLHACDAAAARVGAVNTVRIRGGQLEGFNTDVVGFERTLLAWMREKGVALPVAALVLGSGGAAQAVTYVLQRLQVPYLVVSRRADAPRSVRWDALDAHHVPDEGPVLWVNTTPVGMAPDTDACPPLPWHLLRPEHLVYDLIYNPAETLLLQRARAAGCAVKNGLDMLYVQADAAWSIWNA